MLANKNLLQIFIVSLLSAPVAATAGPGYCAILIDHFYPYDLSDNGEVVGAAPTATGWEAAIWKDGTITRYGTLGGNSAGFTSISSNGRLAGVSNLFGNRVAHAFTYENGIMRDITPDTKGGSGAASINASGEVVGTFVLNALTVRPFVLSRAGFIDLGTPGARYSSITGINDAGTAVGWSETAADANQQRTSYSFVYDKGVKKILAATGWHGIGAVKLNNRGDIVGSGTKDGGATHAFLYSRGVMQDIDTFGNDYSSGLDINERGQVVGQFIRTFGGPNRAFVYENGKMRDLNGMVGGMEGRSFDHAFAINNKGQILAYACSNTLGCEYVLVEPSNDCGDASSAPRR